MSYITQKNKAGLFSQIHINFADHLDPRPLGDEQKKEPS